MRTFKQIHAIAAKNKGGEKALEKLLSTPKSAAVLAKIGDDRWLSQMTRSVFQSGFNWSVVDNKWDGFEKAFHGFKPKRCRAMTDEETDKLLKNTAIVRHGAKIRSVQNNAALLCDLAEEHGSAAKFFAKWPEEDIVGLYDLLKKRGDRLGGVTGQYVVRFMGKDGFIFSRDVCAALKREGVISGPASSMKAMRAAQEAFNAWKKESGRPLMQISRTLAASVS